MRKLIYACCAATVLGAVAAYFVADYGLDHPDSFLGHCVTGTAQISAQLNPLTFLDRVTSAERTGPTACESSARHQPAAAVPQDDEEPAPEAAQDEEENVNGPEVIRVENGGDGADEGGRVSDEGTDRCPAHEDAEAPIARETPEPAAQPLPEYGPNEAPWNWVQSDELDPAVFNKMPACEDGPDAKAPEGSKIKPCVFMPYCEDDDDAPAGAATTNNSFWIEVQNLHLWQAAPAPAQDGSTKTDPISEPAPADKGTQEPSKDQSEGTDAQSEKTQGESDQYNYHRYHDLSCPYTGCPYPTYRCPPQVESTTPATQESSPLSPQQLQQLKKKKKQLYPQPEASEAPGQQGALVPTRYEDRTQGVDTAEYRPSDGDEDAFDNLQF